MFKKEQGAFIFVSHSSKDWTKVREIRNYLEEKGHYPLLFHLKCLDDDDEINDLLKREIQARNWFVLCDSEHARSSKYVSNEIDYIKSLDDKVFEVIDLKKEVDSQLEKLERLSKRATVFLSYSRADRDLARKVSKMLRDYDYQVFIDIENITIGEDFSSRTREEIINAMNNGFFIQLVTTSILNDKNAKNDMNLALSLSGKLNKINHVIPISFIRPDELDAQDDLFVFRHMINEANDFSKGSIEENIKKLIKHLKFTDMKWS